MLHMLVATLDTALRWRRRSVTDWPSLRTAIDGVILQPSQTACALGRNVQRDCVQRLRLNTWLLVNRQCTFKQAQDVV